MKTSILVNIILWGIPILVLLSIFISICIEEKSISLGGVLFIILLCFFPGEQLVKNVKKYYSKPNPINEIEVYVDGKLRIQYQDVCHLCHAHDKNSKVFTAYMSLDGEVSQEDICVNCGKSFLCHETIEELRDTENAASSMDIMMNQN